MISDLVDFTPPAGKMDPEDVRDVLNLYFSHWTARIEERGIFEKFIIRRRRFS